MGIYKAPNILVIHLKRFKTSKISSMVHTLNGNSKKIGDFIQFPVNGLNL